MRAKLGLLLSLCLAACSGGTPSPGGGSGSGGPLGGSNTVSGKVVDFQTGMAIGGQAAVATAGVLPEPTVTVQGSSFNITGIPDNSSFVILASETPSYAPTYSPPIDVASSDLQGQFALTVSQSYLATLASGFGVTPSAGNGILMLQLVDGSGQPKAGIAGSNLVLAGAAGASGPYFLDGSMAPSTTATATSSTGWAVFFQVAPGAITLGQAANATVTLNMPTSPVDAGTVTVVRVTVTDGAPPPPPGNVSFANQVVPIFTKRGCVECHSGGGIGKNLGNLALDGGVNHVYSQLNDPQYPMRIDRADPPMSKVLTMPSYENPPDAHPTVVFTGPSDPDYVTILTWIQQGAANN